MNTHQERGLPGPQALTAQGERRCNGGKSEDQFQDIRNPARYSCLEFWLFANMTVDELTSAREDLCVPMSFMTSAEAVALFVKFFDEVRSAFLSHGADEDFFQMEDESFSEYAGRALRYAFHDIIGTLVNDDMPGAAEFLASYQQIEDNKPTHIECQPGSINQDEGEA